MNPKGWDPESRGMESGIQYLCGFRYMGRYFVVSFTQATHSEMTNYEVKKYISQFDSF